MSTSIKYRPEIDGLRAIAVMAVILFHLNLGGVTGGYIGVDVFFVISGYLITGIILKDCETGSFSLLHFYQRRIRRILPLALVVCVFSWGIAYALYDSYTYMSNTHVMKRSLMFISNFLIADKKPYFAPSQYDLIFLHTWSLSIEEQFYILYPLLFALLYRYIPKKYKTVWILAAILSFIFNVIYVNIDPKYGFYSPFSRAWELLTGAMLAMGIYVPLSSKKTAAFISYIAVIILIASFFILNESINYPGVYALIPVCVTALLISYVHNGESYVYRFLMSKPMAFTGRISYSLYMWHYPLFILAGNLFLGALPVLFQLGLLVLLFCLSWLSYRFIERPFRSGFFTAKTTVTIILCCWIAVYALIKIVHDNHDGIFRGELSRFTKAEAEKVSLLNKNEIKGIFNTNYRFRNIYKFGCRDSTAAILLYGDSHAATMACGLDSIARQSKQAFYMIFQPGFPALYGVNKISTPENEIQLQKDVLEFIKIHTEIKTIVLSVRWTPYLGSNVTPINKLMMHGNEKTDFSQQYLFELGLDSMVSMLNNMGRQVFITSPIPELKTDVNKIVTMMALWHKPYAYFCLSDAEYKDRTNDVFSVYKKLEMKNKLIIIDVNSPLLKNNQYIITKEGKLLYTDICHLSVYGASIATVNLQHELFFKNK